MPQYVYIQRSAHVLETLLTLRVEKYLTCLVGTGRSIVLIIVARKTKCKAIPVTGRGGP
jgi:hypothetical protein